MSNRWITVREIANDISKSFELYNEIFPIFRNETREKKNLLQKYFGSNKSSGEWRLHRSHEMKPTTTKNHINVLQ